MIINVHVLSKYFWAVNSGIETFNNAYTGRVAALAQDAIITYFALLDIDGACRSVMSLRVPYMNRLSVNN